MAENESFFKMLFNTAEWISHFDSARRHFGFGGETSTHTESIHKDDSEGLKGRFGWADERDFQTAMGAQTATARRRLEFFHGEYFYGGDNAWNRFRADEQFSKYRTVLAGMGGSSKESGSRKTKTRVYPERANNQRGPRDFIETETNETLYSNTEGSAVRFLSQLAAELGKAELAAKKEKQSQEDIELEMLRAGALFLQSRGMPRMPLGNETDWINGAEYITNKVKQVLPGTRRYLRVTNRHMNCNVKRAYRKQRFWDRWLMKLMPF